MFVLMKAQEWWQSQKEGSFPIQNYASPSRGYSAACSFFKGSSFADRETFQAAVVMGVSRDSSSVGAGKGREGIYLYANVSSSCFKICKAYLNCLP